MEEPHVLRCDAIWDTGATASVISDRIAQLLGLTAVNYVYIETANGVCEVPSYIIDIRLPGGHMIEHISATGTELESCDALIGMDIITLGDFLITNAPNTHFEFRIPSRGLPPLE
jgi:predicted aspartyl protease